MCAVIDEHAIGERFRALAGMLDERQRRLWAAAEARSHGRGGIAAVARASGLAENTIRAGLRDLDEPRALPAGRVRQAGAGPKRRVDTDETLLDDLKRLVDGDTRGDPERPLLWTSKSVRAQVHGKPGRVSGYVGLKGENDKDEDLYRPELAVRYLVGVAHAAILLGPLLPKNTFKLPFTDIYEHRTILDEHLERTGRELLKIPRRGAPRAPDLALEMERRRYRLAARPGEQTNPQS